MTHKLTYILIAISLLFFSYTKSIADPNKPFVTKWIVKKDLTIQFFKSSNAYKNELEGYDNITIDWGGKGEVSKENPLKYTYKEAGTYQVSIHGTFPGICFSKNSEEFNSQLSTVMHWGSNKWITMFYMFYNCTKLEAFQAKDIPDLSECLSTQGMFHSAEAFNSDISGWDVSKVTNMSGMFCYAKAFNGDISGWDVSNVTRMDAMFGVANAFQGDISGWDVSKVIRMDEMFYYTNFNGDISGWDVSNVIFMNDMFLISNFNGDISRWNVSNVTNMESMFNEAEKFDQPLDDWEVSNVTNMDFMFAKAKKFNQPLNDWNVSKVTTMESMFNEAEKFNQPLDDWEISNVNNMDFMFNKAKKFNQPLNDWTVTQVTKYDLFADKSGLTCKNTPNFPNKERKTYCK